MENDYNTLREIFEMAEILVDEGDNSLEIEGVDEKTGNPARIVLNFNDDSELIDEVTVVE